MAYDQIHIVDATSQMIEIALRSSSTGQLLTGKAFGDMTIKYQREGAATAATVSVVTATKGSYTSGGFVETDIAGLYQFGIPNAAIATGALAVTITFSCTGAIDVVKRIVLIGADLRNASSLGLAYLTGDAFTRLGAPAGASVSADVASIKTDTGTTIPGRLPAALTAGGNIKADTLAISGDSSAADAAETFFDGSGYIGLNNIIGTVISVAGNVQGSVDGTVGGIEATGLNAIADAVLKRDWTLVTGVPSRSLLNALRFLRNKWSVSGTTLTVTEEDDATTAWTATLSTDAAADPVTGSDPA